MPRQFNVFSPLVVPVPGETFDWVATTNEGNVTVSPTPNTTWPLTGPSYPVPKGGSHSATAKGTAGATGTFVCDPVAPNMETQTIVIASQDFIPCCSDVKVQAGDYFVWQNTTSTPVVMKPDETTGNWWPLDGEGHMVPANGYLTLLVPAGAEDGTYQLSVTNEDGSAACPDLANDPVIRVGDGMPKPK